MPDDEPTEPPKRRLRPRTRKANADESSPIDKAAAPDPARVEIAGFDRATTPDSTKAYLGGWRRELERVMGQETPAMASIRKAIEQAERNLPSFGQIAGQAQERHDAALERNARIPIEAVVSGVYQSREVRAIQALQAETTRGNETIADLYEAIVLQSQIAARQETAAARSGRILIVLTIFIAIFTVAIAALTWVLVQRAG